MADKIIHQNGWEEISRERVFENRWRPIDKLVMRQPNGEKGEYYFNIVTDAVCVLPITAEGRVVVNDQFHILFQRRMFQLAAGMLDEADPLEGMKRELLEETGYASDEWSFVQKITLGSWGSNSGYLYLAQNCKKVSEQNLEPSEDIRVVEMEMELFLEYVRTGKIETALSALTAYAGLDFLNKIT